MQLTVLESNGEKIDVVFRNKETPIVQDLFDAIYDEKGVPPLSLISSSGVDLLRLNPLTPLKPILFEPDEEAGLSPKTLHLTLSEEGRFLDFLEKAILANRPKVIRSLFEMYPYPLKQSDLDQALISIAAGPFSPTVKTHLIETAIGLGADPNLLYLVKESNALSQIIPCGSSIMIEPFLQGDVDLNRLYTFQGGRPFGRLPLAQSVYNLRKPYRDQVIPLLLEAGADPDLREGHSHLSAREFAREMIASGLSRPDEFECILYE